MLSSSAKRLFVLISLILLPIAVSCENGATTERPVAIATSNVTIEILRDMRPEAREERIEVIQQNNCGGTAEAESQVQKSRSITRIIQVGSEWSVDAKGQIGFAGTDVGLGATVAAQLGHSYGTTEDISRSVTVKAKPGTRMEHHIKLYESWEIGNAKVVVNGKEGIIPFSFRNDFAIELIDSKDIDCPVNTGTPPTLPPSPAPGPTSKMTPPPPTSSINLRLQDGFSDSILDMTLWNGLDCKQGKAEERDGQMQFHLPINKSSPWESCNLLPKVEGPKVRKVSLRATLTNGTGESSWIGIYGYCGGKWLNFMISPAWVGFSGEGVERTRIEDLSTLPITRTLIAEWTGNELRLTIVDSNKQKSIPCAEPPAFVQFGAGTNLGGYVDGAIDDVQVWTVAP
jgi:hypothetical protein